ncbi:hypothetical protein MMAG44476_35251 [Mycolicibacterium mageritense DSM 44476 = CIP 104973]|uniref:SnoaL-like domain-containing protein n=1 Tax=Mycolicibacterium mageritense TaxID=53462 RepID=A0ABM7I2N7_MYCME|nr:nuclear transport factor 2 family protein [Mycolicibacterium mageritense]MCC9184286.1 nuclear transport factor 2 family protein [Mycolicibacterium mageritense]BBX37155.1 hypothetical protein MMAGJ_64370 [Mycolicibacterium mageritense]
MEKMKSVERQIEEILARYVRASDSRDGTAQAALFAPGAVIQMWSRTEDGGYIEAAPEFHTEDIEYAVATIIKPHPPGGFSHHVTTDHIVTVDGEMAHISAQFIVYEVRTLPEPPVRPVESGYFELDLELRDTAWRIVRSDVKMDLPLS